MKVLHVITSLGYGGAEMMLYRLLRAQGDGAQGHHVVSLTAIGGPGRAIRDLGISTEALGLGDLRTSLSAIHRLQRIIRREQPDIVQTWMYHSDLLGGIAARLTGTPVVWGIHNTTLDPQLSSQSSHVAHRTCALLSSWVPDAIVSCSVAGWQLHVDAGYDASRFHVIPNGFDLETFSPAEDARLALRDELGLPESTPLIGIAARFDPQKDLRTFISAARLLSEHRPDVHFVMAGEGVDRNNAGLGAWLAEDAIDGRVHLLGLRGDMQHILPALDLQTMTSAFGEAFPLVLGEAMACGVPCVATNIGDAAMIVGDTGIIVPPRSPAAVAEAWESLLNRAPEDRARLGREARNRIARHYSLEHVGATYTALYQEVLSRLTTHPMRALPTHGQPSRPNFIDHADTTASPGRGNQPLPDTGALVVSLDFELLWGQQDMWPADGGAYLNQLLGTRTMIPRLLGLFDEFGIRATWATVGMLFARTRDELAHYMPRVRPDYVDPALSPYGYEIGQDEEEDPLHFAPSLIDVIRQHDGQEIGTHTFGHYYCLEPGHTPAALRADLDSAVRIAKAHGLPIKSIVLPRNQYSPSLDSSLLEAGITTCRGNRPYWPDRGAAGNRYFHPARRMGRILDTFVPVVRQNSSSWTDLLQSSGIVNVPANRLLVPRHPVASGRVLQRVAAEMRAAAKDGRVYHIWWHPENYGLNQDSGLAFLRSVFEVAAECKSSYGMQFLSMADVATHVQPQDGTPARTFTGIESHFAEPEADNRLAQTWA